ncbi:hypothetical protein K6K15_03685 [Lacticaseibacillus paracasei]|uniref:hypothetical protein n=1 Tax=Lacticaseibacillus paracasei TaxID=1597 RepID=UPI00272A6217|nr:hypothetical protein [Lacticaseibacillus paracasei]WKZ96855.1 hypothetical protein K6K15_03685 [Lacticaseibacillus paracasei]
MLKVVKRPKEYIAIKVPEGCEDVGKLVSNEFKENGIPIRVNVRYDNHVVTTFGEGNDQHFVKQGDMLVADYSEQYGYVVHAMSQEDFDKKFKPVDDPVKGFSTTINVDAKPILDRLQKIKAEMSTKIEGVELPDHAGFSESFVADQDETLNDFQQKQEQSSQRASTPHVRIEFNDINDVPHVWIDGKRLGDEYPLRRINLEWNTNDAYIEPKHFLIDYFDMTKEAGAVAEQYGPQTQQRGVGQSNGVVRRSSAPRSEE